MSDAGAVATVIAIAAFVALFLWFWFIVGPSLRVDEEQERPSRRAAAPAIPRTAEEAGITVRPSAERERPDRPAIDIAPSRRRPLPARDTTVSTTGTLVVVEVNQALDDERGEWVTIVNAGDRPVQIQGWRLTDSAAKHVYTFPDHVLEPGQSVKVHMWSGEDGASELYVGRRQRWWNNEGDTAYLYDADGTLVHTRECAPVA